MGRLRRFPDHRFVGIRDTMLVYDSDDDEQFAALEARATDLGDETVLQSFGPDSVLEAVNRGFSPVPVRKAP